MSMKKKTTLSVAVAALIAAGASAPQIAEQFLKEKEGYSSTAYPDSSGIPTICDGLISYQGKRVVMGMKLTDAQCSAESQRQKKVGYEWIDKNVPIVLNEPQKAAVFSFCYWNLGVTKCRESTFFKRLVNGDIKGACAAITWWIKDRGRDCRLTKGQKDGCYGQVERRAQESELMCWDSIK